MGFSSYVLSFNISQHLSARVEYIGGPVMNPVLSRFNAQHAPRPSATTAELDGVGINFFHVSAAAGDG